MKIATLLLLIAISDSASGQNLIGKYYAYYGHSLDLKSDSTFRYEYKFDLFNNWAVGRWTFSKGIVSLKFMSVYDTLKGSLVLSSDDKATRISDDEFALTQIQSRKQRHTEITDRLILKRQRLYLVDKNGRPSKAKTRGFLDKKKRPTYYFKAG